MFGLRVGSEDLEFLRIPAGEFIMGSACGLPLEEPVHPIAFRRPFFITKYLVTQDSWQTVTGSNPSRFTGDPRLPVDGITWEEASRFCRRLSETTGKTIRLPTEAEWEYACRGGTGTEFFFGGTEANVGEYAWYDLNSGERTRPVGLKKPNPWGLFDIVGNLWEWCEDDWHSDYQGAPSDGSAWCANEDRRPTRCLRGGAWDMDAFRCRSAYRSYDWKELGTSRFGVRVVLAGEL